MTANGFNSADELREALREQNYLADRGLSTGLYLALALGRPILVEGEAGVGKTELARALAATTESELIRLQCYEGIDASQALYEWDYPRQLLYLRALGDGEASSEEAVEGLFSSRFLLERPLLKALRAGERSVLLIDEIDRADDEFEAFLLEVLSDFQVTVPEIGSIQAEQPPAVILTSNRTRELHDALKRRCLYHWIDYPTLERELEIVRVRAPEVPEGLAHEVAGAVARIRDLDVAKRPGVAETIDWARAMATLGATEFDRGLAEETVGWVAKEREDLDLVRESLSDG